MVGGVLGLGGEGVEAGGGRWGVRSVVSVDFGAERPRDCARKTMFLRFSEPSSSTVWEAYPAARTVTWTVCPSGTGTRLGASPNRLSPNKISALGALLTIMTSMNRVVGAAETMGEGVVEVDGGVTGS